MEFIQIKHSSNYMGWHEVTYKVEGYTKSFFIKKWIIDRFIESPQHQFIEPYGEYDVKITKDGIFLTHKYDTSG